MKLKLFILSVIMGSFVSVGMYAQDTANTKQKSNDWAIGYKTGAYLIKPRINKVYTSISARYAVSNGVYANKSIGKNLAFEIGVNYASVQNGAFDLRRESHNMLHPEDNSAYNISVPVSVHYYLVPANYRFRPYVGVGMEASKMFYTTYTGMHMDNNMEQQPATTTSKVPYVSVAVTQGVVYQVNTRLQIRENIHFQRDNVNGKRFGIDVGVGCRLGRRK